jgi:hypothetical protein
MGWEINWRKDIPDAQLIRKAYRMSIAVLIRDRIRERVSKRGEGSTGPLKGYSTNPLVIEPGSLKPKRKPARGWYAFHGGGYKQYRQEIGLISDLFVFSNKGSAWRDWRYFALGQSGSIAFGFASAANTQAADEAIRRGRPDMFEPGDVEMNAAADKLLEILLQKMFG